MAGTPQTTPMSQDAIRVAPFGRRLAASAIDGLLIWAASMVVVGPVLALGRLVGVPAGGLLLVLGAVAAVVVAVAVPEARPAGRNGQSFGKQFLGMRVAHLASRRPLSLARAIARATIKWLPAPIAIVAMFFAAAGAAGGAAIFWGLLLVVLGAPFADTQRRAIHDRATGTIVLDVPADPVGAEPGRVPAGQGHSG
jgi:uncharacterized RDD family membrane protein YckC